MAVQSRQTIKSWFETGDYPTQEQFNDWIDSFYHKNEDSIDASVPGSFDNEDLHLDADGSYYVDIELPWISRTPELILFDGDGVRWVEMNLQVKIIASEPNTIIRLTLPGEITGTWYFKVKK
jgi:hypothetical protein